MSTPPKSDDIFLWPCGTWCYRSESSEYHWMSDDYATIPAHTARWYNFLYEEERK